MLHSFSHCCAYMCQGTFPGDPSCQELTQVQSLSQEDAPGGGNCNPLQYSCLENPMDGGAWWATVHGSQRVGHD